MINYIKKEQDNKNIMIPDKLISFNYKTDLSEIKTVIEEKFKTNLILDVKFRFSRQNEYPFKCFRSPCYFINMMNKDNQKIDYITVSLHDNIFKATPNVGNRNYLIKNKKMFCENILKLLTNEIDELLNAEQNKTIKTIYCLFVKKTCFDVANNIITFL